MRLATLLLSSMLVAGCDTPPRTLSIVSFNIWGGGANNGRPLSETVAVLQTLNADVFALQEVRAESAVCDPDDCLPGERGVARELAQAIGYHLHEQSAQNDLLWANAILSRYPLRSVLPQELGVVLDVNGESVYVFNVHLTDYPYQPYQLTGIAYGDAPLLDDAAAAVAAAENARGAAVDRLLKVSAELPEAALTIVCGDFNEPSHLDWTRRAAESGRQPLTVPFPASRKLADAGFVDAYRASWPDEVAYPGLTWTSLPVPDPHQEHHDRIDFVYLKGKAVRVMDAAVAGESGETADIVIQPWPSDHRAVLVRVSY
ncbi:MAG: endonuclease/exonuclease/phosphatase family protein [Woeseiaceae bacterium]|nr:endonuclease/exonuclease/phosphatase family protein [Woeseiaceae bacterium]